MEDYASSKDEQGGGDFILTWISRGKVLRPCQDWCQNLATDMVQVIDKLDGAVSTRLGHAPFWQQFYFRACHTKGGNESTNLEGLPIN